MDGSHNYIQQEEVPKNACDPIYVCVGAQLCVSSLFADQTATDVMLGTDEERMMIMMNSPLFSH